MKPFARRCGLHVMALWAGLGFTGTLAASVDDVPYFEPRIELPEGPGREVILRACTRCHDLRALTAFQGYWNREQWEQAVRKMVKNGAPLQESEVQVVVDYITRHFGPGTRK